MKYIVLLGDGMAGYPIEELGGKTTLEYAKTPNMDYMASTGKLGMAKTVPENLPPGSDVANLSVLGYDPQKYYTGRAPLEAASIGVELGPDDVAYRCNLVSIKCSEPECGIRMFCRKCIMEDFSAGHITTPEASVLIKDIDRSIGSDMVKFYPGVSYRHLMVWKGGEYKADCTPPHDITGRELSDHLPKGVGADFLLELMKESAALLESHQVNRDRIASGKLPANSIWLWGQGKRPVMPTFREQYGLSGAMISAVDLMNGIAAILGLKVIHVEGATGYIDTNYKGKAEAALKAIEEADFVYVHVEAPDEAGHGGNMKHKIQAIEDFDEKVVGTVLAALKGRDDCRVLVMPDHPTPIAVKSHTRDAVPFILWDSGKAGSVADKKYDEPSAKGTGLFVEEGWRMMEYLLKGGL